MTGIDPHEYSPWSFWQDADPERHWLSCPLTENGTIRIMAGSTYSAPLPIDEVQRYFHILMGVGNHRFVPDDISLLDETVFRIDQLRSPKQITDAYLLALATRHGAALATFDARIGTNAVRSSEAEIFLIP